MSIDSMIDSTIGREGGYSNNPNDRGGETMWGITIAVARANGYTGPMRSMSRDQAKAIYRSQYAIRPGFAAVETVSPRIAEELFDTGVNMGPGVPSMWLQQWLNALNRGATDYPDIGEDGDVGGGTVGALKAFMRVRGKAGEDVLLKALNCSQGARYLDLARNRKPNESFVFGWLANRVGL